MITLTGTVSGVDRLSFVPRGVRRLTVDAPLPDLQTKQAVPDGQGRFSALLLSTSEVAGAWDDGWCWICTEYRGSKVLFVFAFASVPADLQYATVRPLGGLG